MKQLLQHLNTGDTTITDVPVPSVSGPALLIEARASVVSAGTERMLVEFGRANLLTKARSQPDKVKQVLSKARTDGLGPTLDAVRAKLDAPIPIGYCHAGVVVETGSRPGSFAVGDRVVTNGPHAEYVRVPHTLAAKIPDNVSFEAAAFTPVAAIGLQGIRLAAPTVGETVVVYGLGLIGLLTTQLARASGCRVIGIDRDPARLAIAERMGAIAVDGTTGDVVARVTSATGGVGADIVLLTLASSSNEPIHQAAEMSRKRGRLVLVGVTGLELRRDDFYKKELSFMVSCSYGPGRYDPAYEDAAQDYPLPFVRWTEQRNLEAVLMLMASGQVDPTPLITHRFTFDESPAAYEIISGKEPSIGVVLRYPEQGGASPSRAARILDASVVAGRAATGSAVVGVIGAGNFATRTLLPVLKEQNARLRTIASTGGVAGAVAGGKFGFERITSDVSAVLEDDDIDTVFVLTRHDSHAELTVRALEMGKNVFVEKPLALSECELDRVASAARNSGGRLMVGFNRRFAPLTQQAKAHLRGRGGPVSVIATVNAGYIPPDHWTQDPQVGGGRIIGEACHWMDLACYLVESEIVDVMVLPARNAAGRALDDISHLSLAFADGSTAVVHYLASGAKSFPKERIECFFDGKTIAIDNWRRLQRYGVPGPWVEWRRKMDKGHAGEIRAWLESIRDGRPAPIALEETLSVSRWAIRAAERAREGLHGS